MKELTGKNVSDSVSIRQKSLKDEGNKRLMLEKIERLKSGSREEKKEVFANSYKVETLILECWNPHRKGDGYSIRVMPMHEGVVENLFSGVVEQTAEEVYGEPVKGHEIYKAAESGDPISKAIMDLAWDRVYRDYYRVTIRLTPEQIAEIDEKYSTREGRNEFNHTLVGWIKKENRI